MLLQINEIRNNSRAASARQTYLGYMDMAFKNPGYSVPDYAKIGREGDRMHPRRLASIYAGEILADAMDLTALRKP